MIDTRAKFEEALAAFATPGNRWDGVSPLTYWGVACGMDVEAVIDAAHGVGVTTRDADIRRGMVTAAAKVTANAARFGSHASGGLVRRSVRPRTQPKPLQPTDRVRRLIELGKDVATMEALRELSPVRICPDEDPLARRVQTELHLLLMFGWTDVVSIRREKSDNTPGRFGENMRPLEDWFKVPGELGEIVRPNPFTGKQGTTVDGKPSFAAKNCIAEFRHMVFEFDEMSLANQCRFWTGFIRHSNLPLVALTFSGGKSIHGVVRCNAPDEEVWNRCRKRLIALFASDPDPQYRIDRNALHPLTGCRLAGVTRKDTGRLQMLLYGWKNIGSTL